MEQAIFSMVEGQPVPTRTELFIDYGMNISHTILRIRLARPDLYEEYKRLEAAALEEAQRRVAEVVRTHLGHEGRATAQFRAIAREYNLGEYTMRRLRKQARGGKQVRSAWDWKRIQRFLSNLVKTKDPTITSVAQVAAQLGPEYRLKTNSRMPPQQMSSNTLAGKLRQYPHLREALLKLCAKNRQRANKESK